MNMSPAKLSTESHANQHAGDNIGAKIFTMLPTGKRAGEYFASKTIPPVSYIKLTLDVLLGGGVFRAHPTWPPVAM